MPAIISSDHMQNRLTHCLSSHTRPAFDHVSCVPTPLIPSPGLSSRQTIIGNDAHGSNFPAFHCLLGKKMEELAPKKGTAKKTHSNNSWRTVCVFP